MLDHEKQLITETIGFEFAEGELQTVNESDLGRLVTALKAQPSGVVLPELNKSREQWARVDARVCAHNNSAAANMYLIQDAQKDIERLHRALDEVARLNPSTVSAGGVDERAAFEAWYETTYGISLEPEFRANHFIGYVNDKANHRWTVWQARAALSAPSHGYPASGLPVALFNALEAYKKIRADFHEPVDQRKHEEQCELIRKHAACLLSAPSHGEQVLEGWQLVPVEPTDAMLEAGDKYIGTPATYKAMLSACPSPAITKDFSQFLSAVMDAAGLIRHGRQSKELSEYLGMKCMEYRGVAPSVGSKGSGAC